MEQQIGTFEAKTHFSQVIEQVENGADFIVTKRGKPVARIIPFKPEMTRQEAFAQLIEMRKHYRGKPGDFNVQKAVAVGRL
jgi:prevent-host-death family protein